MIKIGKRDVVHTAALLFPQGEYEGSLSFKISTWEIKIAVRFVTDEIEPRTATINVQGAGDSATIIFRNWTNSLGTATGSAVEIASLSDGRKVYFVATHWAIGVVQRLDLQFLAGAS